MAFAITYLLAAIGPTVAGALLDAAGSWTLVYVVLAVIALLVRPWRRAGWWLGSLVCSGMIVGYVLSRTIGLPQGYKEEWGDTAGTVSLVVQAVFLLAAALTAAQARRVQRPVVA